MGQQASNQFQAPPEQGVAEENQATWWCRLLARIAGAVAGVGKAGRTGEQH